MRIEAKSDVTMVINGLVMPSAVRMARYLVGITHNYTFFDSVWMIAIDHVAIENGCITKKRGIDELLIALESYINGRGDDAASHVFLNVKPTESHRELWKNKYRHYILENKPLM